MPNDPTRPDLLAKQVGAKAARKLRARRDGAPGVWSGLGMMGLIGWSVVVPTLLGAAVGLWLDSHYPGAHTWTLALLVAGLVLGCLNAWRWVAQQDSAMHEADRADESTNAGMSAGMSAGTNAGTTAHNNAHTNPLSNDSQVDD